MERKAPNTTNIEYSIIVPTFRECANLEPLVRRVFTALSKSNIKKNEVELLVVDDNSCDGSEEKVEQLAREYPNVRIVVRKKERGLSSAVLHGFSLAKGNILLCMDADLQHPPEKVPEMLNCFSSPEVEFALGTRYGGTQFAVDEGWPLYRQVISKGARLLAYPLTPLSDPMSGFFAIRKSALQRAYKSSAGVNPVGFKIALELYVKSGIKKHKEVLIVFGLRTAGESKLSGKVMVYYLRHLGNLYWFVYPYLVVVGLVLAVMVLFFMFSWL